MNDAAEDVAAEESVPIQCARLGRASPGGVDRQRIVTRDEVGKDRREHEQGHDDEPGRAQHMPLRQIAGAATRSRAPPARLSSIIVDRSQAASP